MDQEEIEDLADRIFDLDHGGMGEWEDGFAAGLRKAAELVREAAKELSDN
jgi:hypothetical protein